MAVRVQPRQLAFALPHAESLTRDNFLEGPANEAALSLIESWPDWPNRIMLLVGPEGSGKSHLAAIWAEQAGARSTSAPVTVRESAMSPSSHSPTTGITTFWGPVAPASVPLPPSPPPYRPLLPPPWSPPRSSTRG